jgi:hypothetical protein
VGGLSCRAARSRELTQVISLADGATIIEACCEERSTGIAHDADRLDPAS